MGSRKLMDRVLNFMGFEEEEGEGEQVQGGDKPQRENVPDPKKKATVVNLHSQRQVRVVVVEPKSFDEAQEITEHLKGRRPVIINLEHVEAEVARRIVDFVSGATYALSGTQQKVSAGIFLFAPNNVDIEGQNGTPERGIFSWIKN